MAEQHLIVAAFWTATSPNYATEAVADAIKGLAVKGSGSVVSVRGVDAPLRSWLRAIQLQEAADFDPLSRSTSEESRDAA